MFEQFPKFRCTLLECQAGWLGAFLSRGDAIFKHTGYSDTLLKEAPSFYFRRQCFISADPEERVIAGLMPVFGEDKFFWASDFPHPDHPGNYVHALEGLVEGMTETGRRGILAENVAREYALD